ncbi:MAG: ABC-2 family transporter protein [Deltaproteobacteria bacterium]|nr:ABC-2 family transporter protein [Deltaproteobacteria bacterium]
MQYRADFLLQGLLGLMWVGVSLIPLNVLYRDRQSIAGWTWPQALLVTGWFTALRAALEGAVSPSLTAVVEHVRRGTLDFVLLKPADSQFLVSTARFEPWKVLDLGASFVIMGWAFHQMGRAPAPLDLAAAALLGLVALIVLYSMWILVISLSFFIVRADNLSFLFSSLLDAARWPVQVFRGALRFLFTFIFPLALMTTYPAMAMMGTLDATTAGTALLVGFSFAAVARVVWLRALRNYTSASS